MLESRAIAQTSLLLLATLFCLRHLDRVYEDEFKRSRRESDKWQVSFANGRDYERSLFLANLGTDRSRGERRQTEADE